MATFVRNPHNNPQTPSRKPSTSPLRRLSSDITPSSIKMPTRKMIPRPVPRRSQSQEPSRKVRSDTNHQERRKSTLRSSSLERPRQLQSNRFRRPDPCPQQSANFLTKIRASSSLQSSSTGGPTLRGGIEPSSPTGRPRFRASLWLSPVHSEEQLFLKRHVSIGTSPQDLSGHTGPGSSPLGFPQPRKLPTGTPEPHHPPPSPLIYQSFYPARRSQISTPQPRPTMMRPSPRVMPAALVVAGCVCYCCCVEQVQ